MEEAERLCDRIGIIDEGRIRAEGTRRELVGLIGEKDRVTLVAGGSLGPAARALASVERVQEATATDGRIELVVEEARSLLPGGSSWSSRRPAASCLGSCKRPPRPAPSSAASRSSSPTSRRSSST